MIGYPGSGKSTLSKAIRDNYNIGYISSGDIARDMAKKSQTSNDDLNSGKLASEDIMRTRILAELNKMEKDVFILDGFPRYLDQDKWLHSLSGNIKFKYIVVETGNILINMKRLDERNRSDDNLRSVISRFEFYQHETSQILMHHRYISFINNKNNGIHENCVISLIEKLRQGGISIVDNK